MVIKILERKKEKRAWIRVFEASIAIIIVCTVLLTVYLKNSYKTDNQEYAYSIEKKVLEKVASNSFLRANILSKTDDDTSQYYNDTRDSIKSSIYLDIPPLFDFDLRICNLSTACQFLNASVLSKRTNIYVYDRIIVGNYTSFSPKKVRLFLWEKI